jgi:hypothetical protein
MEKVYAYMVQVGGMPTGTRWCYKPDREKTRGEAIELAAKSATLGQNAMLYEVDIGPGTAATSTLIYTAAINDAG